MRQRALGLVDRWTGTRTFIIASALVFLVLVFAGAIGALPAILAFLALAGIAVLRGTLTGETKVVTRAPMAEPVSAAAILGAGAGQAILNQLPDPVVVLDGTGRVILTNRAANALIGEAALGKHVATVLRIAPLMTALQGVSRGGEGVAVEYSVPVPVERHYNAIIRPIEIEAPGTGPAGDPLRRRKGSPVLLLLRDITEMRRVEAMRVDFIANASHELKTPLASLSGFIETLKGHAKDDPEAQARFLDIMADQAGRMRRLIEGLLSLSRIELREHMRPVNVVDLHGVVNDVVDGLTPLAEKSGVEIAVSAPEGLPSVRGDRDELVQVVQNLVDNALRYGRSGKRIEIALAPDSRAGKPAVRLSVRDFGPGIAREDLPRLTERFYRVEATAGRVSGGTGLGLAIVKHIVNRHEGTLAIDSELGVGSVFTVTLPAIA
ncbi:MAG: ATP-binding protein [Parvibaculum sp.]|uniref:ATP-binding protein n=1 Tax=Parvibaculum sp. TaxID=2024848 RepID=UPI003C749747